MDRVLDPTAATGRARLLAPAFAASLVVHGAAVAVLAWLVAGGADTPPSYPDARITATLASSAPRMLVEPALAPLPTPQEIGPAPGPESALLPVPLAPSLPKPPPRGSPQGRAVIQAQDVTASIDPTLESLVRKLHPDALRALPDFEIPPPGIYPRAAVADQRQLNLTVIVVVDEQGQVDILGGGADDRVFGPAIRASVGAARARAHEVDGTPRKFWFPLLFMFEYTGPP